jgi:hypothetical protein
VQNRPHRRSLESLEVLPVYAATKSDLALDKVATLLSRQRVERSPMRPGAGEYQVLGWVNRIRSDHPLPQPSPV